MTSPSRVMDGEAVRLDRGLVGVVAHLPPVLPTLGGDALWLAMTPS